MVPESQSCLKAEVTVPLDEEHEPAGEFEDEEQEKAAACRLGTETTPNQGSRALMTQQTSAKSHLAEND